MTARPNGDIRTLAIETDREWTLRALCASDPRYSDGPFGTRRDATEFARRLAHRCRAHCPVIEECADALIAQSRTRRPRLAVQAGVYFPDGGSPRVLPDPGCGQHCAGLPAVHREVAHA